MKKQTAIEYCEEKFPGTTQEFKKILDEMYSTFCKKQRNYGPDNISVGSLLESSDDINVALTGLWFRKNDKIQRLKQIVVTGYEVPASSADWYSIVISLPVLGSVISP